VPALCRSWLVTDISEDYTASAIRVEVRKVREVDGLYQNQMTGIGQSEPGDEEKRDGAMSRPMGKSPFWG
jgi:hypothetical protein